MEEAGVVEWQDPDGNEYNMKYAAGCKVPHNLIHPDMIIVMDKVGENTSQKVDGLVRGKLSVCAKGMVQQQKSRIKDKL